LPWGAKGKFEPQDSYPIVAQKNENNSEEDKLHLGEAEIEVLIPMEAAEQPKTSDNNLAKVAKVTYIEILVDDLKEERAPGVLQCEMAYHLRNPSQCLEQVEDHPYNLTSEEHCRQDRQVWGGQTHFSRFMLQKLHRKRVLIHAIPMVLRTWETVGK
jgi:hypothetical protein